MNSGKVLLGLLAGIAAGATLGILFAPEKGTATRRRISRKANDYSDGLGDKFNDFIDSVTTKFESLKSEAIDYVENGQEKAENIKSDAVHLYEKGKAKAEDLLADGNHTVQAKMNQVR